MSYPEEIDGAERIVRVLRTPHFFRNGNLVQAALRPQVGKNLLSIMRWSYRLQPGSALKGKCQEIGNSGRNSYCGVATMTAGECWTAGVRLEDAREEYDGHAHMVFPFVLQSYEPQENEEYILQVDITRKLMEIAVPVLDPAPEDKEWTISDDILPL